MSIPGHELVIARKPGEPRLMRADCTCGRKACVWYGTIDAVEKSFSHHVAHIAEVALRLINRIEERALEADDPRQSFVAWTLTQIADARPEERW